MMTMAMKTAKLLSILGFFQHYEGEKLGVHMVGNKTV